MYKLFGILIWAILTLTGKEVSAQWVEVDSLFTRYELGNGLHYISADKGQMTIGQLMEADYTKDFLINSSDLLLLNENEYKNDLWITFDLINVSKGRQSLIIDLNNSLIDEIEFYEVQQGRILQQAQTGDAHKASSRSLVYRNFAFPLEINPGDTHTIFMKFDMDGRKIHLPIIIQKENRFIERVAQKEMGLGIYYGVLILITVLFFYLYYLIPDRAFLFFALYMFAHSFLQLCISGVANIYLWPDSDFWADRCVLFFMAVSITLGLGFVVEFIGKEKFNKWLLLFIRIFQGAALVIASGAMANETLYNICVWMNYRIIPPFYVLMFLVAASFFINKYLPTRIFVIGYLGAILSISGIMYYAYARKHENVFTNNMVVVGEMIKCVMLGIALLDRLKIFKEEKEKAQAQSIAQLEEMNRYREELNTNLEAMVKIKSSELIEKQKEVGKALIWGEEQERKRVAQELHDGMGSLLSTLRLNAEAIDLSDKALSEKEQAAYLNVIELIDKACSELRTISHDMLPIGLNEFGIERTLETLIRKINTAGDISMSLDVFGMDERLTKDTELAIYRIILELINNILKHSKASQASIQLVKREDMISILVEDNGIGMQMDRDKKGIGMINIETRVEALNGKLNMESVNAKGTTFNIEIPV